MSTDLSRRSEPELPQMKIPSLVRRELPAAQNATASQPTRQTRERNFIDQLSNR